MSTLFHVGNAIVDIALTIEALPERGGDAAASASAITAGGAVNTLVAAVRDGLPAVHAGGRGTGPFADVVAAALADAGVSAVGPVADDLDVGFSVVLVDAGAERTFVTRAGAEARLTLTELDRLSVSGGDIVVVTGYALEHSPIALSGWVGHLPPGVVVVMDPSPVIGSVDTGAVAAVLGRADVLTANAREGRLMVGVDGEPASDASALARLLRPGAVALVRDGARGCWVARAGGSHATLGAELVPGFEVTAVDSTGAGDAHLGVLCAALSRGDDLLAAVRRANAAAALAVTRRGSSTSPTAAEIDALLAARR